MSSANKALKKERRKHYTKGDLNRLVDGLCHPLYKANKGFMLVGGLLHAVIEEDPPKSARKFLRYNLPAIINQMKKQLNSNKH